MFNSVNPLKVLVFYTILVNQTAVVQRVMNTGVLFDGRKIWVR